MSALVPALLLTGCGTDSVGVDDFSPTAAGRERCAALMDALPDRLADESVREVDGSPYAAAWGDPAIVLRCGVGRPAAYATEQTCFTRDGIDWFIPAAQVDDLDADVVLTLVERRPAVEVRVPADYRPNGPSEVMADLDRTVRAATEVTGHCQ